MSRLAYSFSKWSLQLLFGLTTRRHVRGLESGAPRPPFLLAGNHISHFDPPMLTSLLPFNVDWMAVKELFAHPLAAAYFRAVDTFPTDRERADMQAVRTALDRLKRGRVVGMFPEGGIRDGARSVLEGAPLRPGAAALAQMADVPIVPFVLIGTDRLYCARNWRRFRKTPVWVWLGEPIHPDPALPKRQAREAMEAELAQAILRLCEMTKAAFGLSEADLPASPQNRMRGI